jgi:hypothetical protein
MRDPVETDIPAHVVPLLREAAYGQLASVTGAMAHASGSTSAQTTWPDLLARFDRARALLDAIGWTDSDGDAQIELAAHRRAIIDALRDHLPLERALIAERGEAAADQRRKARSHVQAIETFMHDAGMAAR